MGNQVECCNPIVTVDADNDSDDESTDLLYEQHTYTDSDSGNNTATKKQKKQQSKTTKPKTKPHRKSWSFGSKSKRTPIGEANYSAVSSFPDLNLDSSDEHESIIVEELKSYSEIEGINIDATDKVNKPDTKSSSKKPVRKRLSSRNKYRRSSAASSKSTVDELQAELNETEIKLQEQLHQAAVLKQENQALRQENLVLKTSMFTGFGDYARSTKTIKSAHQIPPTPPYRMRSLKSGISQSHSISPELRPVSPITVNITTTSVQYQHMSQMESIDLGTSVTASQRMSPLVDPLPPASYDDAFGNIVYVAEPNDTQTAQAQQTQETAQTDDTNSVFFCTPSPDSDDEYEITMLFSNFGIENEKCNGIEDCVACKRIVKALEWYFECQHSLDLLMERIQKYEYGVYIVKDYQHILNCHLSMNSSQTAQQCEIEDIEAQYDAITKMIKHECNVNECRGYQRYQKGVSLAGVGIAHSNEQNQVVSTMDALHCYFLHLDC